MRNHKTKMERVIDSAPLKPLHYKIWYLVALGVFMDGLDLFIIAVALPLVAYEFHPTKWELGLIGAASSVGAILGSSLLGYLTDKWGRKYLYIGSAVIFFFGSLFSALSQSTVALIIFRFLLGVGVGADYPIGSTYLSEFMPRKIRSRSIISAFTFQAIGAIGGSIIGLVTLTYHPYAGAWRWMLGLTMIPALFLIVMRTKMPESALWLQGKNEFKKASVILGNLLEKSPEKVFSIVANDKVVKTSSLQKKTEFHELFTRRFLRQTLLTSIPWFLMDVCLYGVKVFSPTILTRIFTYHAKPTDTMAQSFILKTIRAITGDLVLNIFLTLGFFAAITFVKSIGTIRLQCLGFLGMAAGMLLLSASSYINHSEASIFVGFIIFNFMINFGPNPTTYMLPTERFPSFIRASGHGFAASCGKIGAALGVFFLPVMIAEKGIPWTMFILALCSIVGFLISALLGRPAEHMGSHTHTH